MDRFGIFFVLLFQIITTRAQINPYADCCENYCMRDDEKPYLHFGTKTGYEFVHGKASNQHIVPSCTPVQFWSFNRHGARLPSADNIMDLEPLQKIKEQIILNYDQRGSYPDTGRLCDKDLEAFRRWNWNTSISLHNANILTDQGRNDMMYLARRYQARFPKLLRQAPSDSVFQFHYTETERTRESFEAFAQGLFGDQAFKVHGISRPNDNVTNAYDNCPAWKRRKQNPEFNLESKIFKHRDEYKKVIAHVSRRLGFRYTLNESLVEAMYDMCRFEKAWNINRASAWCAAFTKEHLKVMEYKQDLNYYYKTGYGSSLNQKLGCSPMRDMINRFEQIASGDRSQPKAVFYFSHSAALHQLLVALGMYKDSLPLKADNMMQQLRRRWKTSLIGPFSANLVAVFYECTQDERNRVMFLLNEHPVEYPGCSVGLCSWNYIKQELSESSEQCDLDFCYVSSGITFKVYALLVFLPVLSYLKW